VREILLLGAGNNRGKKVLTHRDPSWNGKLVTVDMDPTCKADLVWDLEDRPLPFDDGQFDEIHAYDCLEHWGRQGDWKSWFDEMAEYHRLLKPGGLFAAVLPYGEDRYADPGHTRFFGTNHFKLLDRDWVTEQLRAGMPVTDYRWYWKNDFKVIDLVSAGDPVHHFGVVLEKR
jgi:SAM-dependent methyltransferase